MRAEARSRMPTCFPSNWHSSRPRLPALSAGTSRSRLGHTPSVRPFVASSVPVSRLNGPEAVPGSLLATMASADFWPDRSSQISPGKNAMLPCTTAAFTSTGKPDDFAVLCQLVVPCRPSMRFLFIGSQVSPSLPFLSRSPFPSWLQMVVSSFSCLVFLQGTCTPFTSRPCWAHTRRSWTTAPAVLSDSDLGFIDL